MNSWQETFISGYIKYIPCIKIPSSRYFGYRLIYPTDSDYYGYSVFRISDEVYPTSYDSTKSCAVLNLYDDFKLYAGNCLALIIRNENFTRDEAIEFRKCRRGLSYSNRYKRKYDHYNTSEF